MSGNLRSYWAGESWGGSLLIVLAFMILAILGQMIMREDYITVLLALAVLMSIARLYKGPLWKLGWPVRLTLFILAGALLLLSTILKHDFSKGVLNFVLLWLLAVVFWVRAEVRWGKAKKVS